MKSFARKTTPQGNTPGQVQETETIEKPVEPPPEPIPIQEVASSEKAQEDDEAQETSNDAGNNAEAQEGNGETQGNGNETGNNEDVQGGETEEAGTLTDREYEALLAYIKDFINKNLVYPPMARRRNIQGIVAVYFEIERNGGLVSVSVDGSSGSSILDNAAVSLIKKIHLLENMTMERKLALRVNIDYKLTE
jgi:protein TonB